MNELEQKMKDAITKLSFCQYSPILTNLILMTKIRYVDSSKLPFATAAIEPTSSGITLYINKDIASKISLSALTSVLAHEYWHVINCHCWAPLPDWPTDNMAADIEINQVPYIELSRIGFSERGKIDKFMKEHCLTYDQFGFPANKSRETYYELLKKKARVKPRDGDMPVPSGGGTSKKDQKQKQGQSQNQEQSAGSKKVKVDSHDTWKKSGVQNAKEIYRRIVEEILETAKRQGLLPGSLIEEIEARWKRERTLEQILRRIVSHTYRDSLNEAVTRLRPSRRNPLLPGTKEWYGPRFVFALDTSGSMSTEELEDIVSVFKWCSKKFGSAELIQCDAAVHEVTKDITRKTIIPVKGRGGTDFRPVFKYIEEKLKNKIDLLIFGTDTEGTFPEKQPPYKVVWVVPKNVKPEVPFGTVVKL